MFGSTLMRRSVTGLGESPLARGLFSSSSALRAARSRLRDAVGVKHLKARRGEEAFVYSWGTFFIGGTCLVKCDASDGIQPFPNKRSTQNSPSPGSAAMCLIGAAGAGPNLRKFTVTPSADKSAPCASGGPTCGRKQRAGLLIRDRRIRIDVYWQCPLLGHQSNIWNHLMMHF